MLAPWAHEQKSQLVPCGVEIAPRVDDGRYPDRDGVVGAIKGLEQRGHVLRNLARDEGLRRRPLAANLFEAEAKQSQIHAAMLRDMLLESARGTSTSGGDER